MQKVALLLFVSLFALASAEFVRLEYNLYDRCSNYKLKSCSSPLGENKLGAPLPGLKAKDGSWMFEDKVIYLKDEKSVKVCIRLAHDPLKDRRLHCVQRSRDGEKFLKYEEVEREPVNRNECNSKFHLVRCSEKGAASSFLAFKGRKRGLSQIERGVHSEVRRMARGFGEVFLDADTMLQKNRKGIGDIIELSSPETKHVTGSFKARGKAWKALKEAPGFSTEAVGKRFTLKTGERVNATDASQSRAIYSIEKVTVVNGTLHWPSHCSEEAAELIPKLTPRRKLSEKLAVAVQKTNQTAKKGLVEEDNNVDSILTEIGYNMDQVEELGHSGFLEVSRRTSTRSRRSKGKSGDCQNPEDEWDARRNQNDFPDFTLSGYYPTAKSGECASMKREVQGKTYGELWKLINGPQKETELAAVTVQDGIAKVEDLETKLRTVTRVCGFLDLPLNVLGYLPYVGPAFKVFRQALKRFQVVIDDVLKKVNATNRKIAEYKIDERMCKIRVQNDKYADKFRDLAYNESRVIKPILEIDSMCGGFQAIKDACTVIDNLHKPVNSALNHVKAVVNQIKDIAKWPVDLVQKIDLILNNPVTVAMDRFFSTINDLIRPFTDLLNRKISVEVPIPGIAHRHVCVDIGYPCGTKYCKKKVWRSKVKYPCGVDWCHRRECTNVPYPTVTMTGFSFTVQQIVTGVLNVLDLVMNALMKIVERIIPGLPNLGIPIPGFDFPNLRIPYFPPHPPEPAVPVLPPAPEPITQSKMCTNVVNPLKAFTTAIKNLGR